MDLRVAPASAAALTRDVVDLRRWMDRHQRLCVLTGAGCSTASGIPDYRDESGAWKRRPPVMILAFRTRPEVYRRYWARAYAGWPRFSAAAPGPAHRALADLERQGGLRQVVTQNVDGLHQRAGSSAVIDLHGRLDVVMCVACGDRTPRADWQQTMAAHNPDWSAPTSPAPDGDADIDGAAEASFVPPRCGRCGGLVKPDVVFFGENVPPPVYDAARAALSTADALLVVGSSLMVYSGYRFVTQARAAGLPVAIVNRGRTRGDADAELKVSGDVGDVLTAVVRS
jgi:NAD-dependent SIR2 family protein deacetylase